VYPIRPGNNGPSSRYGTYPAAWRPLGHSPKATASVALTSHYYRIRQIVYLW
jgi:hypothetical protein